MAPLADPTLETLWKHVLDHWDNDRAHGAFLEHCQATDQLVEAAVRYRGMTGDRARGELANKRRKGVTRLARANRETPRTTPPPSRKTLGQLLLIAFFLLATVGLLAAYAAR